MARPCPGEVRVRRTDFQTGDYEDIWLDTLEKGACMGVYSVFNSEWTSPLTYKAAEKNTILLKIKVSELEELSIGN